MDAANPGVTPVLLTEESYLQNFHSILLQHCPGTVDYAGDEVLAFSLDFETHKYLTGSSTNQLPCDERLTDKKI